MKLATILAGGAQRLAAVVDDARSVLDLGAADTALNGAASPWSHSMLALMQAGQAGLDAAAQVVARAASRIEPIPLSNVTLMSPLPIPVQMRDALCFELHCRQAYTRARELKAALSPDPPAAMKDMEQRGVLSVPREFFDVPVYYKQNRFSVAAPDSDIVWPRYSQVMDYELELGIFIGTPGTDIPREQARRHIFGYTVFNDLSARDAQFAEQPVGLGPAKGKDFNNGNPIGPWIVTADEIGDPYDLEMIVRVNGEERGRGNSASMHWTFEDLIARISQGEDLHAGEFIGSGTVGNGCGLEIGRFLEHGDVVEMEIEKIGALRNRILRHPA